LLVLTRVCAIKLDIGDTKILFPAVICNGSERIFSTLGKTELERGPTRKTDRFP
jgi:plasmid segregation protein ParM